MAYTLEELRKREKDARYKHFKIDTALISAELILEVAKEGHNYGDITDKTLGTISAYAKAIKAVSIYADDKYEEAREAWLEGSIELNKNNDK